MRPDGPITLAEIELARKALRDIDQMEAEMYRREADRLSKSMEALGIPRAA